MLYKTIHNPAIVQAFSHPLRARILSVLQEREASPKELSDHFGVPLANVAYHFQVLRKLKLIRLVKKTPRRGAIEHHYKADHSVVIDHEAWSRTPGVIKERMVATALEEVGDFVTGAAAMGGFERRNAHLTRSRVVLDEEAWETMAAKLDELVELTDQLEKESAVRLRRSDHEAERSVGVVLMLFDAAPEVPDPDAAALPAPSRPAARGSEPRQQSSWTRPA
jgi:DNA-binding transcriptional ArsR family regulator